MINLRYHIVSITAVFLALGIGITMGSTFLGKATLDRIDQNVRNARTEVHNVKAENDELRKQNALDRLRSNALIDAALPRMFDGTLTDVPVVVVAADGVDQDSLDDLRVALTASGASFEGTLIATDKFELNGGDAADLGAVLDSPLTAPVPLRKVLAEQLAGALLDASVPADEPAGGATTTTVAGASGSTTTAPVATTAPTTAPAATVPGGGTTAPTSTTTTTAPTVVETPALVAALLDAGFFDYEQALGGVPAAELMTHTGYRYVFVTGPTASLSDDDFIEPVLQAMTIEGPAPVVVASAAVGTDPEAVRDDSIGPLVKDGAIGNRITTVDDIESFSGLAAVVLSVQDLGRGLHGHYGVGDGAKSQLPVARG